MVNKSKGIGTQTESAVAAVFRSSGFPHVERRALRGNSDAGDLTGIPGLCVEIKGGKAAETASDGQVELWLADTERERINAHADIGVLILKRRGIGAVNAGRYWAIMTSQELTDLLTPLDVLAPIFPVRMLLADAVTALRYAGFGDPLDEETA